MDQRGLKHFGIETVKQSATFASKQKRFAYQQEEKHILSDEIPATDKPNVPGPGAYHKEVKWSK